MKKKDYSVYMPDVRHEGFASLKEARAWIMERYRRGEAWIIVKGKRVVMAGKA
jgi:hypothetical protein